MIEHQTGPVSYKVQETDTDITYRRHGDQLRSRVTTDGLILDTDCTTSNTDTSTQPSVLQDNVSAGADLLHMDSVEVPAASPMLCRSVRERKLPECNVQIVLYKQVDTWTKLVNIIIM